MTILTMKPDVSHLPLLKLILCLTALGAITALLGCNNQTPEEPAAPLGDILALEKLADAYKEVSNDFPVNPINLAPDVRKKFVKQVFSNAGYGYQRTLSALSEISNPEITKLHRDMQELLFLPHYRVGKEVWSDIYTDEEIQLVRKIEKNFSK